MSNKVDQEQLNDINELLEEGEVLNELPAAPPIVNLEPNGEVGTTTVDSAKAKKQAAAEKKAAADAKKAETKAKKEAEAEAKKAAKQAELDKKAAEKAAKEAEKITKVAKKTEPKPERLIKNGIKYPNPGTSAFAIWKIINDLSATKGELATVKEVSEATLGQTYTTTKGDSVVISQGNVTPEYWAYKKFYGFVTPRSTSVAKETPAAESAAE